MHGMPGMGGKPNPNFPKAQAIKIASMAYFISKNLPSGKILIHYNGAYHSDNHLGIVHYLKLYKPGIKVATISTILQEDLQELATENKGLLFHRGIRIDNRTIETVIIISPVSNPLSSSGRSCSLCFPWE